MTKRHDNYAYDLTYEERPEQIKRRERRNRDRRRAISEGLVHKGSHMDVHHPDHKNLDGIKIISAHKNRSMK